MTPDHTYASQSGEPFDRFPFSHLFHTLRNYRRAILLGVLSAAVAYLIIAAIYYLLAPSQRLTALPFQVQFKGADRGEYPNGTVFSATEIISTPILLKTHQQNDLGRFLSFQEFAASVFVLESNPARDALAREYTARLADNRLSAVDRDRLQREYELKLASLSKNLYSLHYVRGDADKVPDTVAKKALHDILRNWVDLAANEQHVLEYRVPVLSPDVVAAKMAPDANPIITIVTMRSRVMRLNDNIRAVANLPNATMVRTSDGLSLNDINMRLDDVVRYRLEPLVDRAAAAGLDNRLETMSFLTAQLAYDERQLEAQTRVAEASRRTLSLFMNAEPDAMQGSGELSSRVPSGASETVMPQLNETFLDRLIQLTSNSAESEFRKELAETYRTESVLIVPLEQAVAYDRAILESIRSAGGGSQRMSQPAIALELETTRQEVRQLALKVHEIHKSVSKNLNPSGEMFTAFAAYSRTDRTGSLSKMAMYGILVCALALVGAIVLSLLHNRLLEEEKAEEIAAHDTSA